VEWNRFDICEAWFIYLSENHGGQWSPEYARLCKLTRPGFFKPSPSLSRETLQENGKEILWNLENPGEPIEVALRCAYIGDGYCLGATDNPLGAERSYWDPAGEQKKEIKIELAYVAAWDAPSFCEGVGATIQGEIIGDGYSLANKLAPYLWDPIIDGVPE
jgi:hypothetical protein